MEDSQFDIPTSRRAGAQQERCLAVFYRRAVHNPSRSEAEGRAVYEDKDFVQIIIPGTRDIVDRPVNASDKGRWPDRWLAYQTNKDAPLEGTPLTAWGQALPYQMAELGVVHCTTVEQLAGLPDSALESLGPGYRDLQNKAKAFLSTQTDASQVPELKSRINELEAEVARLTALMAESDSGKGQPNGEAPPKRRGRPPKASPDGL